MSTRIEDPRTIGINLRGDELVRFVELDEEHRKLGADFAGRAGSGKNRRTSASSGPAARVCKHHKARTCDRNLD